MSDAGYAKHAFGLVFAWLTVGIQVNPHDNEEEYEMEARGYTILCWFAQD